MAAARWRLGRHVDLHVYEDAGTGDHYDDRVVALFLRADDARAAVEARAELHALHATDDYQRWARAVVERDAAREAVGRVRALHTPNDPPSSTYAKECMGCDGYWPCETARALDGGAAT